MTFKFISIFHYLINLGKLLLQQGFEPAITCNWYRKFTVAIINNMRKLLSAVSLIILLSCNYRIKTASILRSC